jgi:hypothetical protein
MFRLDAELPQVHVVVPSGSARVVIRDSRS